MTIYRPAWIAAAAGILLSLIAGYVVAQWERRIATVEFESVAEAETLVVSHGMQDYIGRLQTLRTLFESANEEVTRSEFEVFSKRLFEAHTGVLRVAWIPRVKPKERAEFEAAAVSDGVPNYHIKSIGTDAGSSPANPEPAEYLPVFYSTEPKTSGVYGLDYGSAPERRLTLEKARDYDVVAVFSSKLAVRAGPAGRGVFVCVPVYVKGTSRASVTDRRRNIVGYVVGVFELSRLLHSIREVRSSSSAVEMSFYPRSLNRQDDIENQAPDYSTIPQAKRARMQSSAPLRWSGDLNIGDASWAIVVTPRAGGPLTPHFPRALIVFSVGLIITLFVVFYLNMSSRSAEKLKVAHRRVLEIAQTDTLTGLANRAYFMERLEEIRNSERVEDARFSILMLDLDRFKNVNDSLGHAAGDSLLREAAQRLQSDLREADLLARLGGDEFAIIQMASGDQREDAANLAARMTELMMKPFQLHNRKVEVGTSIGIAMAPEHGRDPLDLLRRADVALYRSKAAGRSCFTFFDPEMAAELEARNTLEGDLREAIARRQFEIHYQPVFDIATGLPCGAEALVRWRHPTNGLIPPDKFIPLAEASGLIVPLGEWILRQACIDAASWPLDLKLAVNLSPVQFKQKDLFGVICHALFESGLAPARLEIEITESVLLERGPDNLAFVRELKDVGVSLALDDFGTGYSSLSYLTMFPFDKIKIDKSFIRDLATNLHCAAIVSSIVTLARGLNISVTAEGVETAEQLALLRQLGANFAQGYLLGRPVAFGQLDERFKKKPGREDTAAA